MEGASAAAVGAASGFYTAGMGQTVVGLAEITLWSRDLDKSLAFYCDIFGLEPMDQPPGVKPRFLRAAAGADGVPQMIVLVPHPDPSGAFPSEKPMRTLHHLAFAVSRDSYQQLQERCRAAGLEIRNGIHPVLTGVQTIYVDDPDGNEVEVISPA
jgi:catechol 2,3-dioxygenase-like lactoylglutathione lyase family enzyme